MQDKDVKSELDLWAKIGNMGNSYEPGAVSEESIKQVEPEEEDERILDCKNGGR